MISDQLLQGLPGAELIREGVHDVIGERITIPALVVSIARARLTRVGVVPNAAPVMADEPERELYRLLRPESGDAYSRYNALVRELTSFLSALDVRSDRRA